MEVERLNELDDPMGYITEGIGLRKAGQFDEALAQFEKAKRHPFSQFRAYFESGNIFLAKKQPLMALNEFTKALSCEPNSAPTLTACAVTYMKMGDTKNSIQYFEKALRSDPTFIQAAQYYTHLLNEMEDFQTLHCAFLDLYPYHKGSPEFLFSLARFMIEDSPYREDETQAKSSLSMLDESKASGFKKHTMDFYYAKAYFTLSEYDKCCAHIVKFFNERRRIEGGRSMVIFKVHKADIPKIQRHVTKMERKGDKVFLEEIEGKEKRSLGRGPIVNLE